MHGIAHEPLPLVPHLCDTSSQIPIADYFGSDIVTCDLNDYNNVNDRSLNIFIPIKAPQNNHGYTTVNHP